MGAISTAFPSWIPSSYTNVHNTCDGELPWTFATKHCPSKVVTYLCGLWTMNHCFLPMPTCIAMCNWLINFSPYAPSQPWKWWHCWPCSHKNPNTLKLGPTWFQFPRGVTNENQLKTTKITFRAPKLHPNYTFRNNCNFFHVLKQNK